MLSDYLRGTVEYEIKLENPEDFVNRIKKEVPILMLDIPDEGTVRLKCLYQNRADVERIAAARMAAVSDKKQRGLPVLLKALRGRLGLILGCILAVIAVYVSSLFVWEIRVVGNEKLRSGQVIKMLEEAGFYEGIYKGNADVRSVADTVLINEDAISWLAINLDGTVAHVEIKEALPAVPVPKKQNVNLVASANGIILRVDAHEGGTKINKGDVVTKGQLLVSAFVDKRTGGSMLRGARGYVWAQTDRKVRVVVPKEYSCKKYTENVDREYNISFLGMELDFSLPQRKGGGLYDCKEKRERLKLGKNTFLPITLTTKTGREYTEYKSRRTTDVALEEARRTAKERLYEFSPGFTLAQAKEEYYEENGMLVYTCTFSGIENIAKELEFELS